MEKHEEFLVRRIIEDMSDGVMVFSFDGRVVLSNGAAERMLRMEQGSLSGRTIAEFMSQTEQNDELFELVLDAVYSKKKVTKTVPFFYGDEVSYLRITTDFLTNEGEKVGVIAQLSDITESTLLFIENKRLNVQITDLMNSFVEVMVTAIEEKMPYNANHTKSMVKYAERYLSRLGEQGKPSDFDESVNDPLLMSIWLHDIGKLLVPQEILDKPTRLGSREADILHRIETSELAFRIKALTEPDKKTFWDDKADKLTAARDLILSANKAGFLNEETIGRLREVSKIECLTADGRTLPLLDDAELEAITVVKGTLTAGERKIIESHVSLTTKLLSKMKFEGKYRTVPQWAGSHHELLDGSGYPNKLCSDAIPWETRLLTILDVYDALTAEDRPYKPPMPPERAFEILRDMAEHGKIDGDILSSFIESEAWKK